MKALTVIIGMLFFSVAANAQQITSKGFMLYKSYYQDGEKLSRRELLHLLESDDKSRPFIKKSKDFQTASIVTGVIGVGLGITWFVRMSKILFYEPKDLGLMYSAYATSLGAVVFKVLSHNNQNKAVKAYNGNHSAYNQKPKVDLIVSGSKLGVTVNF